MGHTRKLERDFSQQRQLNETVMALPTPFTVRTTHPHTILCANVTTEN